MVHSLAVVKAMVLCAIVVNAFSAYVLVRAVAPRLALPTIVALAAFLQIRYFHDSVFQFSLHMQTALDLLLSAIALVAYGRTRRLPYAVISVLLYLGAALTYEATYALFLPLLVLLFRFPLPVRTRIALSLAYFAVPVYAVALRSRMVVPDALDAGLVRGEHAGSTIYLDDSYPAHARDQGGTWNVKSLVR